MSRKPRFKVQRLNSGDAWDYEWFGNKRWTPVHDDLGRLGYTLTREEASDLYWKMVELYPEQTYRIAERR